MITNIPTLMPGAEPYLYRQGEVGCLILHGLTATPSETRWFGQSLAAQGITVYGVRNAGHGIDFHHLRHLYWEDWYASALDGYHILRGICSQVFVAGHSMGGLLALLLGASESVDGLVLMSVPVMLDPYKARRYVRWLKYVMPYTDQTDHSNLPAKIMEVQKQRGEPVVGRIRYDRWASQAVEQLFTLMRTTDTHLHEVTVPTLLMYSRADQTVDLANQDYIRNRIQSKVIESHTFDQSGHILLQDVDHEEVARRAGRFILQSAQLNQHN